MTTTPPSSPEQQASVRESLAQIIQGIVQHRPAAEIVRNLVDGCLTDAGTTLDLAHGGPACAEVAQSLPARGWQLLDRYAQACGAPGIAKVRLPYLSSATGMDVYVAGLNELPRLGRLIIAARHRNGTRSQINLGGLLHDTSRLTVALECWRPGGAWEVIVPVGTRVIASGSLDARLKATVRYIDWRGATVGEPAPLQTGLQDEALDGPHSQAQAARKTSQPLPLEDRQSGIGQFSLRDPVAMASKDARMIQRHLAVQWIRVRTARPRTGPASLPPDESTGATIAVKDDLERMIQGPAVALFEAHEFGNVIGEQLANLASGETRHLLMVAPNHIMSLELRAKDLTGDGLARRKYIVNFYDPARPSLHQHLAILDHFQVHGHSLRDWLGDRQLDACFGAQWPRIGALYQWQDLTAAGTAPRTAAADPDQHVPETARSSAQYLYWLMADGHAGRVARFVREVLGSTSLNEAAKLTLLAGRSMAGGPPALYSAMGMGRTDVVAAYLRALLDAPDPALSQASRYQLARAAHQKPGLRKAHAPPSEEGGMADAGDIEPCLCAAVRWGRTSTMTAYMRALLDARLKALAPDRKLELLRSLDARNRPLLYRMAVTRTTGAAPGQPANPARIYKYVYVITQSRQLAMADKTMLVASIYKTGLFRRETAARGALKAGSPGAAGAMVCAVLDASPDTATAQVLLGKLDVKLPQLLRGLLEATPGGKPWAPRIVASLKACSLGRTVYASLVRDFRDVVQNLPRSALTMGARWALSQPPTLLPPMLRKRDRLLGRLVTLAHSDSTSAHDFREARLRGVRFLDLDPVKEPLGFLLCTARGPLQSLEPFRANQHETDSAHKRSDMRYYQVPVRLLKLNSAGTQDSAAGD